MQQSIITGTGAYIPGKIVGNDYFLGNSFFRSTNIALEKKVEETIQDFASITGIKERRYAEDNITASQMGLKASQMAVKNANIDVESIDYIIFAHNYGDKNSRLEPSDFVPSLASKVKFGLCIKNPKCIAYDLIFGCPGWLQGLIQADIFIKSGNANCCLVIGADTLSRVIDPSDRDSMIFSDGAGACVLKGVKNIGITSGVMNHSMRSDTIDKHDYIYSGQSYGFPDLNEKFIKMHGHKVYNYALTYVPSAMKECLDNSGFNIDDLKMIFIHQANEKMDEIIIKRFYELYGINRIPEFVMPMNIRWMGNSSVATIPTLFHQVIKEEMEGFRLKNGDLIMFASVGAGMNINAVTYVM